MSCKIPAGSVATLVQGNKVLFDGVLYNLDDCVIEKGVHFETKANVKEVGVDSPKSEANESNEQKTEEPKPKKFKKPVVKPSSVDENIENTQVPQPQKKDDEMGLPVQAPQDSTPGQGQPVQPIQQPVGYPQQPMQPPVNMQLPQGYALPPGFTVPPQAQQYIPQQFMPQQPQETHATTEHNQDGMDMNMIKTILNIAGDNPVVLVALIGAYLGFTWMKKMEKIKEKEAENGGQHASACDSDRKSLNSKFSDMDFKVQKIDMLENKVKQMGDVNGRLTKLEENSNGLTFNDTTELEEALAKVVKKVEALDKKIASLVAGTTAPKAVEPVKKPTKAKETKSVAEFPPEEDDE